MSCPHILRYAIKRCFDWCEEVCRPRSVYLSNVDQHAKSYAMCLAKCLKACKEGAKEGANHGRTEV